MQNKEKQHVLEITKIRTKIKGQYLILELFVYNYYVDLIFFVKYNLPRIQQASAKLRNVFVKALLWC